jgi:hypothetical protein
MYAKTLTGRISVIIFVILGIVSFTEHITKLASYLKDSAEGKGNFNNKLEEQFVIISGDVSFEKVEDIARYAFM